MVAPSPLERAGGEVFELQTLPNIDINIKTGNSLISRFALDEDLKAVFKQGKYSVETYKIVVQTYKDSKSKEEKAELQNFVNDLKEQFKTVVYRKDPLRNKIQQLRGDLLLLTTANIDLFGKKKTDSEVKDEVKKLEVSIQQKEKELEEKENSKVYHNAFEWRFEFPEVLDNEGNFIGFDVVIGNPPYFSISTLDSQIQQYFLKSSFETFAKGSDIYCLFYERGFDILKPEGTICFITSNRFCFTNYGVDLRTYLSNKNIQQVINFNDLNIFENANVGSIILMLEKKRNISKNVLSLDFKSTHLPNKLDEVIHNNAKIINKNFYNSNQWNFDNNEVQLLKAKIESKAIPFINWNDIAINRGVTTGANNIFVINSSIKEKLCKEDASSLEIIKPILRGRDIKRFGISWSGDWIIFTKRGINIEQYPAIKKYLTYYQKELEPGIGRKPGNYKWYEIQDITAFWTKFEKKKLIWTRLSNANTFAISQNEEFSLDSTSFAVTNDAEYLCGILNSKVVLFYFKLGSVIWGKDGIKWFGKYFDYIPIPQISIEEQQQIIELVNKILAAKKENPKADTSQLENEIDQLVYKLYNLTPEEIKIIEDSVK